ncbi:unnamed protein product, partial [Musa hybrid cultivar]
WILEALCLIPVRWFVRIAPSTGFPSPRSCSSLATHSTTHTSLATTPARLFFVSFAYSNLLMLFLCLRRLEKLAPDDPPEHRKRTLSAVWVLFTVLNLAFAWRAPEILPLLLTVAMAGFYVLIIYPQADGDSGRSMVPSAEQNV